MQKERCSAGTAGLTCALQCQLQSVLYNSTVCRAVSALQQPCHCRRQRKHDFILAAVSSLAREEEYLLLSKNPRSPQLISQTRGKSTQTGFLGKDDTCRDTGMRVWDNHFPPALWSVKPQGGTLCPLSLCAGKAGGEQDSIVKPNLSALRKVCTCLESLLK